MRGRCLPYTRKLVKTLLYNFIRQEKPPPPGAHVFPQQSDGGGLLYGLASGVATGLWTVFTLGGVGSKAANTAALSSPLANQSLLLLLVLANLTDAAEGPHPYRQAIISFQNTQDNSPFPSSIPHAFQINFNSLYTTLYYAQDLNVIEEVIRMMLEVINSCLATSLHHNPNLDIMQNIDLVTTFFSSRLLQAGAEISVEWVLEIIKQGIVALSKDRLKKFQELKFKYGEEEQPEEFFIPYFWSLVYNSVPSLYWSPQDIQLLTMDSD
ncbi:Dymeclin [Myotis davidii]|uniref:Dymeclin n=1 Tax=Myotis davidii TaxID=225400 RepID=L5LTB5_MYODS|nr:Dymeclin [Myotis davidii]